MSAKPGMLTLEAKPQPLEIDLSACAVIVVDMQNEFGAKGGMFDRAGVDISVIQNVVAPTAAVLAAARSRSVPVIYLKMQHRPDLSDMGGSASPHSIKHGFFGVGEAHPAPDGSTNRVLIEGHWGTAIVSDLTPMPGDFVVGKHRYSGFFETNLDGILRGMGIEYLVFTGCTTSVCVESTIRDAMFRGYKCCLLSDCTAEPIGNANSRSNHEASLLTIELLFGWVSISGAFIAALEA